MASSEDDKVPPTVSTLESVIEKPAEDQTSDNLADEAAGETDKTEEKKPTEVSDASNEDLAPSLIENKDTISQDPTELKQEDGQVEIQAPTDPVASQPEEFVSTADTEKLVSDGQETEQEEKEEEREEKGEDERSQVIEEEKDHEEMKKEEQEEAGTEKEPPEDATEEPECKIEQVAEEDGESKEPGEEVCQHEATEDKVEETPNGTDVEGNTENIESNLIHPTANGQTGTELSADDSPAEVLLEEEEAIVSQPENKCEVDASEETEQPEQVSHLRQDLEVEEQVPPESTNRVSDEARDTSEDSEQVVPCKDVPAKNNEEEATRVDENTSQDAVSVQESETDSESKLEHGSPAVIKPDVEKDSDSGSSSAADNSSLDLNLSISSFLSKSKDGGSVSMQVSQCVYQSQPHFHFLTTWAPPPLQTCSLSFVGVKTSEKDSEEDTEVHGGWRGGQCDDFKDSYG